MGNSESSFTSDIFKLAYEQIIIDKGVLYASYKHRNKNVSNEDHEEMERLIRSLQAAVLLNDKEKLKTYITRFHASGYHLPDELRCG